MNADENNFTVSHDDIKLTKEFFEHFEYEMSEQLKTLMENWATPELSGTPAQEREFRSMIALELVQAHENGLEILKDDVWTKPLEACEKVGFSAAFNTALENELDK